MGMAPRRVEAWALASLKALRSGNPEAGERDTVATFPGPFETPEAGRLPGPTGFPPRLLPVPQRLRAEGEKEAGQVLQSTAPGPVTD